MAGGAWRGIPAPIWALGFTSLFMDAASEAIHSLLPVFLVGVLGARPALLGLLEGLTAGTKPFSGESSAIGSRLESR